MNITRENVDELNVILKVKVEPADYEERVGNVLNDYRKKMRMDGFRPGKVPPGLIRKMYRKPVLIEEINKLISEHISRFLSDEKLRILGEPLPSEAQNSTIDWDSQTDFEFAFDLGLAPDFILSLSPKDTITQYEIIIDQKLRDSYIEGATRRFGSFKSIEMVEDNAYLKGRIEQVDDSGNPIEGGVVNEEMSLYVALVKDEETRKSFLGKKTGDTVVFDIHKGFPNDTEIASMLNIKKEQVNQLSPIFRFTLQTISRFENATIDQDLFDKIYGKDQVTSTEEFMKRVEAEITANLKRESEFRFQLDVKEALLKKIDPSLPVAFLKRWLFTINEGKYTQDQIEHDFEHFEKDLKWQLIRDKIVTENGIHIADDEILDMAKKITISQFMQYGITHFPEDQVEGYARDLLKREEDKKRIIERKLEEKVYTFIRNTVNVEQKSISSDEFNKLFEKDKKPTHDHHDHE